VAAFPIESDSFLHKTLFEDPFFIAVSIDNELSKKKRLSLDEIKDQHILLLEEGHCLRDQSLGVCHNKHIRVDRSYTASSLETLRAMVATNYGITFIPKICIDSNPMIRYIPFSKPVPSRTIALFWRKSFTNTLIMNRLSDIMSINKKI
jgi:LysR family transcriptional regulator, hydrogen peroxide-inducible genes activator